MRQNNDPKLHSNVRIPCGWTDYMDHVGSTVDCRSLSEGSLIASGIWVREGRQTCFFATMDPMKVMHADTSIRTERTETNSIHITMVSDAQSSKWVSCGTRA